MAGESDTVVLLILTFLFPPAAVAFISGCGADLCLNILLTLLAYLPGFLHAVWLVLRRTEANDKYGYKNWTYTGMGEYRPAGEGPPGVQPPPPPPPPPAGQYPPPSFPPPSQAPVEQKTGDKAPPAPVENTQRGDKAADAGSTPPPAPVDEKCQVPPQAPADQKPADTTAPTTST